MANHRVANSPAREAASSDAHGPMTKLAASWTAPDRASRSRIRPAIAYRCPAFEGQSEQEREQDLDAGLGDPDLLEELVEVPVVGLQLGLTADDLVPLRVVDVGDPLALRALD
jgi:hypothetical protein